MDFSFALAYAALFAILALRFPFVALLGVYCLAPINYWITAGGVNMAFADIHAVLTLPLFLVLLFKSRYGMSLSALTWPILFYFGFCVLSTFIVWNGADSAVTLVQMALYLLYVPLLFAVLTPLDRAAKVFYWVLPIAVIWAVVGYVVDFDTPLLRKNGFGSAYAAALIVGYDLLLSRGQMTRLNQWGRWALRGAVLIILAALVLTLSRGSWLGALMGILVVVALRGAWKTLLRHTLIALPLAAVLWLNLPQQLQDYSFSVDTDRYNIRARYDSVELAKQHFLNDPLLGDGVGLRKAYDATNLVLSTLAESGLLGFVAFVGIFVVFYRMVWRSRRAMSPHDPRFSFLTIGAAVITYKLGHGMVDHFWTRGTITMAWAGVGMVIAFHRGFVLEPLQLRRRWQLERAKLQQARRRALGAFGQPASSGTSTAVATSATGGRDVVSEVASTITRQAR